MVCYLINQDFTCSQSVCNYVNTPQQLRLLITLYVQQRPSHPVIPLTTHTKHTLTPRGTTLTWASSWKAMVSLWCRVCVWEYSINSTLTLTMAMKEPSDDVQTFARLFNPCNPSFITYNPTFTPKLPHIHPKVTLPSHCHPDSLCNFRPSR